MSSTTPQAPSQIDLREPVEEARSQATEVVEEAKDQAQDLIWEARRELEQKAEEEARQVASGLRNLSHELQSMAQASPNPQGLPAGVARQAAAAAERFASELDQGGVAAPTRQLKQYARRNPGRFLACAFAAGALSGRLARNLRSDAAGDGRPMTQPTTSQAQIREPQLVESLDDAIVTAGVPR
jgi:hypothetical protein